MSELEKSKDFLEMFGSKPWAMSELTSRPIDQPADREMEPWMAEFVKKRHSEEAWDAFFNYYNSGPLKRAYCRFAGLVLDILGIL